MNTNQISEEQFLAILKEASNQLTTEVNSRQIRFASGEECEATVYAHVKLAAKNAGVEEAAVIRTGAQEFPDIIVGKYGIEVKLSNGRSWRTVGNSITQSTRRTEAKIIYAFFVQQSDRMDVRYRKYEECLVEIKVTHSPRYYIDMEAGENIFEKAGLTYSNFMGREAINIIRRYYLRQGKKAWWLGEPPADSTEDGIVTSAILKDYSDLSPDQKKEFIALAFILSPEVGAKGGKKKYVEASRILIEKYNCTNAHLRDTFTSKGQVDMEINGEKKKVPRMFKVFEESVPQIQKLLPLQDMEELQIRWEETQKPTKEIVEKMWLEVITKRTRSPLYEQIYLSAR